MQKRKCEKHPTSEFLVAKRSVAVGEKPKAECLECKRERNREYKRKRAWLAVYRLWLVYAEDLGLPWDTTSP